MMQHQETRKPIIRVALVSNSLKDVWRFRRSLVEALLERNAEVRVVAPVDLEGDFFQKLGVHIYPLRLHRSSLNPLKNALTFFHLLRIYRVSRPALVHHFTAKPVVYGSIVAHLMQDTPVVVSTLAGLGYPFVRGHTGLRWFLSALFRLALLCSDAMVFLNREDPQTLGMAAHPRAHVIEGGEGVDIDEFSPATVDYISLEALRQEFGLNRSSLAVIMVSRMLGDKGVREFVEAATIVRQRLSQARFFLVGPVDTGNPACVPRYQLEAWHRGGEVMYLGERNDIRELLALAEVVVLPSYYREGLPRVLLEGAAMGKALIATDIPGCREVVRPGVNGLLIPTRDSAALARAVEELLRDVPTRERFGKASRDLAVSTFSSERVVKQVLALYNALLAQKGLHGLGS